MSLSNQQNQGGSIGNPGLPKTQKTTKRVADIILDKNHIAYNGPDSIGIIFFTDEKTKESANDTTTLPRAKPLNLNNFTTPLIGELVNVIQSTSDDYYSGLGGNSNFTSNYYTPAINIHNNAGSNAVPLDTKSKKKNKTSQSSPNFEFQKEFRTRGSQDVAVKMLNNYLRTLGLGGRSDPRSPVYILSQDNNNGEFILRLDDSKDNKVKLGTYYKENPNQKNLNLTEGGTVNQGKSGQRISFSANNKANQGPGSGLGGIEQNRAMVLSLGDGEVEDINDDDGTIHLATNQKVNIKTSSNLIASLRSEYKPYVEPLKEIEKEPVIAIPTTNPTPTLQVENHFAGIGAKVKETTTTTTVEAKIEDPFITDPVFAALDVAQEEGFITYIEGDEITEISGTELDADERTELENDDEVNDGNQESGSGEEIGEFIPNDQGMKFLNNRAEYDNWFRNGNGDLDYPITLKGRRSNSKPVIIDPRPVADLIKRLKNDGVNSANLPDIKHLICHVTATGYTNQHQLAKLFLYDKGRKKDKITNEWIPNTGGWLRHGYNISIDGKGGCNYNVDLINTGYSNGCSGNIYEKYLPSMELGPITNKNSINMSWIGHIEKTLERPELANGSTNNPEISSKQSYAYQELMLYFADEFPDIKIIGHNQIVVKDVGKACPGWDNTKLCDLLNINNDQIYRKFPNSVSNADYDNLKISMKNALGFNEKARIIEKARIQKRRDADGGRVFQNFNWYYNKKYKNTADYVYALAHPNQSSTT